MIVDPDTLIEAQRGQSGELWLRGPSIMKEYWRDPGPFNECHFTFSDAVYRSH